MYGTGEGRVPGSNQQTMEGVPVVDTRITSELCPGAFEQDTETLNAHIGFWMGWWLISVVDPAFTHIQLWQAPVARCDPGI